MVRAVVGVALVAILCVLPWAIHNNMRFSRPVPISNGLGITLTSTYCSDLVGDNLGYWSFQCAARAREAVLAEYRAENPDAVPLFPDQIATVTIAGEEIDVSGNELYADLDEAELDARFRDYAVEWITDHPGYVIRSVPARVGRVLGLYRPLQQINLDQVPDGRQKIAAVGSWVGYFLLLPFSIGGTIALWRRRRDQAALLLTPFVAGLIAVAMTFGNTRYRAVGEPTLAIAAAIGIAVVIAWLRTTWSELPPASQTGQVDPADGAERSGQPPPSDAAPPAAAPPAAAPPDAALSDAAPPDGASPDADPSAESASSSSTR
jgi:hypothetical protein